MKVLSGSNTKWTKEFTCYACKARLEVERSDLIVINDAVAYAGETWDPNVYFKCVVCETYNRVTGEVPSGIEHSIIQEASSKRHR